MKVQSPAVKPPKVTASLAQGRHKCFVMFTPTDRIIYSKPIWKQRAVTGVEQDWVKRLHFLQNITFMTHLGQNATTLCPGIKVNCILCDISQHQQLQGWPSFSETKSFVYMDSIQYAICAKLCAVICQDCVWIIFQPKIKSLAVTDIYIRTICISHAKKNPLLLKQDGFFMRFM